MIKALPQENVIYKFRFRNGNVTNDRRLIYDGIDERNGRATFYNCDSKNFTSMPLKRFSYIHRFNLISKTPIIPEKNPIKAEKQQIIIKIKEQPQQEEHKEAVKFLKKYLDRFNNFTERQKDLSLSILGRDFESFRKDFEAYALAQTEEKAEEINARTGVVTEWVRLSTQLNINVIV